jgi:hypothetical protein
MVTIPDRRREDNYGRAYTRQCSCSQIRRKCSQCWEALGEPRLWLMFIAIICHFLQNEGLVNYSTVLVSALGFSSLQAILLQTPSGALTILFITLAVILHRKSKQVLFTAALCYILSAIGCLLSAVLLQNEVKLLSYYLSWAQTGGNVLIIAMISMMVSGYSKEIFYNGVSMLASTIGNFCGPLLLVESTKSAYTPTMWAWLQIILLCIRFSLARINKKHQEGRSTEPTDVYQLDR